MEPEHVKGILDSVSHKFPGDINTAESKDQHFKIESSRKIYDPKKILCLNPQNYRHTHMRANCRCN